MNDQNKPKTDFKSAWNDLKAVAKEADQKAQQELAEESPKVKQYRQIGKLGLTAGIVCSLFISIKIGVFLILVGLGAFGWYFYEKSK